MVSLLLEKGAEMEATDDENVDEEEDQERELGIDWASEAEAKENDHAAHIGQLIARRGQREALGGRSLRVKRAAQLSNKVLKKDIVHEVSALLCNRSPES